MKSNPSVPVLETERLILRAHSTDDFPAASSMWADPQVVRFIGGKPSSQQQTWARIMNYAGQWSLLGFGYWAIVEKLTGKFIGEAGVADFKRDISPSMQNVPEIGWALAPHAHGRGLATEALGSILTWCDSVLAAPRTVCVISAANLSSLRVAEKLGYRAIETNEFGGMPTVFFERLRPQT